MKQYKCIPGPMAISVSKGNTNAAFADFESIINSNCTNGWSYHSMETITIHEKPGCSLFGQETVTNYYMLIFEREA